MPLKKYRPYTPSRRFMVNTTNDDITAHKPEKSLTVSLQYHAGRNSAGRTTVRRRGGRHKRLYRIIDFKGYDKAGIPATVATVEYDPNRTSRIALLHFVDGEKRYVLARKGIAVGDIKSGNRKQLGDIPEGVTVFNLELTPVTKGKIIKTAGSFATIMGKDEAEGVSFIKMPSGEVRKFRNGCWATIGEVGHADHKNEVIGKAGKQRWLGRKPKVLGINMNPVDHPHGGGEAHSDIGLKAPKTFAGKSAAAGVKTRKSKKWSEKFIVSRRKKNK